MCINCIVQKSKPLIGVVFDPQKKELFYAERNKGAFLNNKKIRVSNTTTLSKSLLALGFYYERGSLMIKTLDQMKRFFYEDVHGIRRAGEQVQRHWTSVIQPAADLMDTGSYI